MVPSRPNLACFHCSCSFTRPRNSLWDQRSRMMRTTPLAAVAIEMLYRWRRGPRTGKTYRCYHSEFPTYGSAHSELVLVCSHRWLAIEVFVKVKTKPEVFNNLYSEIRSGLHSHTAWSGQTWEQAET